MFLETYSLTCNNQNLKIVSCDCFQHFLVAAGSTVTLTFILSSAMCFGNSFLALSEVLSTILFVSGIVTLLQSVVGIR